MITLKSCPNCDSDHMTRFHKWGKGNAPHVIHEIMPGIKVEADVISRYSQCKNCHLLFQNPRLSNSELNKFYSLGYYRRLNNMTKEAVRKDEKHRAKIYAKIVKQHVGEVLTHLDVGCSLGILLKIIGARKKIGVEQNVDYVRYKSIKVYPKLNKVPSKKFNLVTAMHILEHVPSPLNFLKSMTKFVAEDGCLIIEVPAWNSPGWTLRLAHLYHFEPDILKLMCAQAGLSVIHEEFNPHLLLVCKLKC